MRHLILSILFLICIAVAVPPPARPQGTEHPDPAAELEAFLRVPAVAGREEAARDFVRQRLGGLPVEQDAAGNLVLSLGWGEPRRLVVCPLGEPGLLVSRIEPNGYLRVVPTSAETPETSLWAQSHEGNVVTIGGARGWVAGGVTQRSVHLMQGGPEAADVPFRLADAWIDVGAESAAEVEALGIRLLDPVALLRRPARLPGGRIAGPSARLKGACTAMIDAARAVAPVAMTAPHGTVVFAWTASDFLNGMGLAHLARSRGPFDEVLWMSPGFGRITDGRRDKPAPLPADGSGLLTAGEPLDVSARMKLQSAPYVPPPPPEGGMPASWSKAQVTALGLAARYPETPVETVSAAEVEQLTDLILAAVHRPRSPHPPAPPLPAPPAIVEPTTGHDESAPVLAALIGRYGVSGAEGPVREEVLQRLPSWAKPEVDAQGNVMVTVGQGDKHLLFVAHMDEVGFRVAEVLPDGRLRLENRGGMLRTAWEAQAALVHGDRGPVPAVFEPREDWRAAEHGSLAGPLTVWLGVSTPAEVAALGVHTGSTVTMPKRMFRIGAHRALARGFDDRVGCTALLLALARLDPAKLTRRITFAWDVEEEVGLHGALELAKRLTDLTEVHAVDTFVSSDSPRESQRFAFAPLGQGPVLRAMDNATLAPREVIARFQGVAARAGVPVQVGFTGGATDGVPFLPNGATMLPFSWPGRSSHSPVEVADLRDVDGLVKLIVAAAEE